MASTQFLPFATNLGNDVSSQSDWAAASWRQAGWISGILPHQQINKAMRQASVPGVALTQAMATILGADVLDDGSLSNLTNQMLTMLSANLPYDVAHTYPTGSIGYFLSLLSTTGGAALSTANILALLAGALTPDQLAVDLLARINLIDAPTTGLVTKVADLQAVYGTTVSAAQSAAAAAQSAIDAVAAQNTATIRAGAAYTSATNASTSAVTASAAATSASSSATQSASFASSSTGSAASASASATQAANSATSAANAATAASGSASTASTSATNAATYAAASQTSFNSASTAAASASTFADQAASSATSASGSAAVATSKATLAATSEFNAANSAGAAATSVQQIGNVNLVARGRVNLGYITGNVPSVDNTGFGVSGWGFNAGPAVGPTFLTFGAIDVGPLLPNTPYSLSFLARIANASTQSINIDLYPDTLPQVSRTLTTAPQTYKWENITSASADMATAILRFFCDDIPLANGVSIQITDIKLEQATTASIYNPSPLDARNYANASQTNANTAATSASAAASSASSSISAATSAATQAGNAATSAASAGTFSGQASSSASSAGTSAGQASASASAAQSSATAAQTSASAASTAATQASTSATNAAGSAASASSFATQAAQAQTQAGVFATAAATQAGNASASANNAANSATAASNYYTSTVSAAGALTAQVITLQNTTATLSDKVAVTQANYVLKTVATRSDGKIVLGAIGLASTASGTVGQSEIILQADRLVFISSSNVNAPLTNLLSVGQVNGVTTLVVPSAIIGDATIGTLNLKANSVTSFLTAVSSAVFQGDAGASGRNTQTFNFTLGSAAQIAAFWQGFQGYNGAAGFNLYIYLNGQQIGHIFGGVAQQDAPVCLCFGNAVAGSNQILVVWYAQSGLTLSFQTLVVLGAAR